MVDLVEDGDVWLEMNEWAWCTVKISQTPAESALRMLELSPSKGSSSESHQFEKLAIIMVPAKKLEKCLIPSSFLGSFWNIIRYRCSFPSILPLLPFQATSHAYPLSTSRQGQCRHVRERK